MLNYYLFVDCLGNNYSTMWYWVLTIYGDIGFWVNFQTNSCLIKVTHQFSSYLLCQSLFFKRLDVITDALIYRFKFLRYLLQFIHSCQLSFFYDHHFLSQWGGRSEFVTFWSRKCRNEFSNSAWILNLLPNNYCFW